MFSRDTELARVYFQADPSSMPLGNPVPGYGA